MKARKVILFCCVLALFAGRSVEASAEEKSQGNLSQKQEEMPVLTGEVWEKMTSDEKVAFVWGVGHIVTIEHQSAERYPVLKRASVVAKMAEGLAGVPMNTIVGEIDKYYQENPDDLAAPVLEVIWDEMVKPKIKSGIADLPLEQ
ncbi:hypothetical protein [Geobacter sp.]|uniref:hypothetical protein n=1 Tax=Geobacter sp. TaxID=46610 RepID=UPI0026037FED|nr:hypothetical protein [Geobacter sp.]